MISYTLTPLPLTNKFAWRLSWRYQRLQWLTFLSHEKILIFAVYTSLRSFILLEKKSNVWSFNSWYIFFTFKICQLLWEHNKVVLVYKSLIYSYTYRECFLVLYTFVYQFIIYRNILRISKDNVAHYFKTFLLFKTQTSKPEI